MKICKVFFLSLLVLLTQTAVFAQDAKSLADKALMLFLEGNFNDAKATANQALQKGENSIAYAVRSRVYLFENDDAKAKADAQTAVRLSPMNGISNSTLAWFYNFALDANGNPYTKEAKQLAERTLSILTDPQNAVEFYSRSLAYTVLQRDGEAISDLNKSISLNPNLAVVINRRGYVYYTQKQYDAALKDYNKAIQLNSTYVSAYKNRAQLYDVQNQTDAALADYRKITEINPRDADAFLSLGNFYYGKKQYQAALSEYDRALEINPRFAVAYQNRGLAYKMLGNNALAEQEYTKAIQAAPNSADGFNQRGNFYFDLQRWDSAIGDYTQAIQRDGKSLYAFVNRGVAFIRLMNYDKALLDLNKAVELDPNFSVPYFHRGYIYADVGEYDRALTNYSKSIELDPKSSGAYFNRGLIYFEQKHKFDLAEADFTKTVQIDPQYAQAFFTRADLYESMGKDNLADADRKKFNALGGNALPGFENRRRTLFPWAEFDPVAAANALQQGNSTIVGRACASVKNGLWGLGGTDRFKAVNVRVVLYPATPYMEKWYELREKKEDKKTGVFINREAQRYAMMTQTNGNGEFVFSRLKPGKYFIQIIFNFTQVVGKRVYTGSTQDGNVVTDWYEDRNFYIDRKTRLEKFVEIKSDGASEKVMVKNGLWGC